MTSTFRFWRSLVRGLYGISAAGCIFVLSADPAMAQRGREGGREGGGGRGNPGGNQGGGGGARVATPNAGGAVRVGGGARVVTPNANAGGGARAAVQGNTYQGNAAPGRAAIQGNAGVRTPAASANVPNLRANANTNAPGVAGRATADAAGRANAAIPNVNVPRVAVPNAATSNNAIPNSTLDATPTARAGIDGAPRTALRPNLDANIDATARANRSNDARDNPGRANLNADANADFRPRWYGNNPNSNAFRTTFGNAMNARWNAERAAARAGYWGNWAGNVRNGFYVGPSPYFNNNFWSGRNLVGFGLGNYSLGVGQGYGNWWGYSPWVGNRSWNYWYGNPGWNTFAGYYGWNTPYFYDYGPQGNIVYSNNRVLVNGESVGTPTDYAQSAADLAMVTQEQMNAEHDWMPLGTFSVATSQTESNPARVAQIAYDNKQGLISGTIFNRESNNLYTLQGKVDKESQRVAFTIGKDPNVVMETGLYNLTQNETPVLVHFGSNQTATYLFVRLPEPSTEGAAAQAASSQPTAPPADDLRR